LVEIILPASVEILGELCFSECRSLSSVTCETGSRLSGIAEWAFRETQLVEIVIPSSVKVQGVQVAP
jgi:hypothetical protein